MDIDDGDKEDKIKIVTYGKDDVVGVARSQTYASLFSS